MPVRIHLCVCMNGCCVVLLSTWVAKSNLPSGYQLLVIEYTAARVKRRAWEECAAAAGVNGSHVHVPWGSASDLEALYCNVQCFNDDDMAWRAPKGLRKAAGAWRVSVTKGNVVAMVGGDGASLRLLRHHILSIKCITALTDGTVDCYCIGRVLLRWFSAVCVEGVFIYVNAHHWEVSDPLRMK